MCLLCCAFNDLWVGVEQIPSPYCSELRGYTLLTCEMLAYIDLLIANSPWYNGEQSTVTATWRDLIKDHRREAVENDVKAVMEQHFCGQPSIEDDDEFSRPSKSSRRRGPGPV